MTALFKRFSLIIMLDVFSLLILTYFQFSRVGKPILDNKPLHIFLQHGLPESLPHIGKGHKNSLVPNHLMCLGDDVETFLQLNDDLVTCLYVLVKKVTIQDEELGNISD